MLTRYPILSMPKRPDFRLFDEMDKLASTAFEKAKNYPPYNIFTEGDVTTVEMSVIGFSKEDVTVEFNAEQSVITIRGTKSTEEKETDRDYSYRGLCTRNFTREFTVNAGLEVDTVTMKDGLLTIKFKKRGADIVKYDIK
jgi:HSP20 family molecular chaperone IbpA